MIYLYAATLAAGLLAGSAMTWRVQEWRHGAAEASRIKAEGIAMLRRQDNAIDASIAYQQGEAAAEIREREVIKEVIRVVQKPVYREQCLDDDGMRIIAADIQAANARRGLGPALPASSSAK